MNKVWTNVKWLTLNEPNGTYMGVAHLHYRRFITDMVFHYKTHLHVEWGADLHKKAHAHLVVSVPVDELERFARKDASFSAPKHWVKRNVHYVDWKDGFSTLGYATKRHRKMPTIVKCPKRSKRCRRGACTHIG